MTQRLLVISPVRNEGAHIEHVALALAAQTRPPDAWIVVDDSSTDDTRAILERLAPRLPFMQVIDASSGSQATGVKDRLATGAAPRAFNRGLNSVPWMSFTHIAKLDGDTELPPNYFEALLKEFEREPSLGLAGGIRTERSGSGWSLETVPVDYSVPGALKCYSRECLEAIGGVPERLGWDTIDQVYARMRGFKTRALYELVAVHHRPWGSADGSLRGRARHGRCAWVAHYPLAWVLARAYRSEGARPRVLSGVFYVGGYMQLGAEGCPARRGPGVPGVHAP